jgi:hypothetical protein
MRGIGMGGRACIYFAIKFSELDWVSDWVSGTKDDYVLFGPSVMGVGRWRDMDVGLEILLVWPECVRIGRLIYI